MSLKKVIVSLGTAAAIALPTIFTQGCSEAERIRDDSADGIITPEEEEETLDLLTNETAIDDLDLVKNLVNDIDIFAGKELANEGFEERSTAENLGRFLTAEKASADVFPSQSP